MKKIMLLGASGSIGTQTLDVVKHHSSRFEITGLSIGHNVKKLAGILDTLSKARQVCVVQEADMEDMQGRYPSHSFCFGDAGLRQLAANPDYDVSVNAVVDFRGLVPTLTAAEHDKAVVLANKEGLIAEGSLVKRALKEHPVALCSIDPEHSVIFQCLQGNALRRVGEPVITASGGNFRDRSRAELAGVTVEETLQHPNWGMSERITIDSATMMNKGFEVIEAHYLFDIPYGAIDVVIHRESIIHSVVQYHNRTIMAQLGTADMRLPTQYALSYPSRLEMKNTKPFDFQRTFALHFTSASEERYPLLKLALAVGRIEGDLGAVIDGADEEAVVLFLDGKTGFLDIERYIIKTMEATVYIAYSSLEEVIKSDVWAREFVRRAWKGGMCTV